jgi:hypothetical protein
MTRLMVVVPAVMTVALAGEKGVDFLLVLSQVGREGGREGRTQTECVVDFLLGGKGEKGKRGPYTT